MITPDIWGPCLWKSIHIIALGYPESPSTDDMNNYKQFFENLWKLLPCEKCSINYKHHLEIHPITYENLKDTDSLFKWTVDLHNIVNEKLNKKTIDLKDAYTIYLNQPKSSKTESKVIIITILIVVFALISGYLYHYFRK